MSSEAITRNDLEAVLNEVLPAKPHINDYIFATMTANQTLSTAQTVFVCNLNSVAKQVGTSLSFNASTHTITIGDGVNYVAVVGSAYMTTLGTAGAKSLYVYHNNTVVGRYVANLSTNYNTLLVPYRIISVSSGDTITLRAQSNNGTTTVLAADASGEIAGLLVQVIG